MISDQGYGQGPAALSMYIADKALADGALTADKALAEGASTAGKAVACDAHGRNTHGRSARGTSCLLSSRKQKPRLALCRRRPRPLL